MTRQAPAFAAFAEVVTQLAHPLVPSEGTMVRLAAAADLRRPAKSEHLLRVGSQRRAANLLRLSPDERCRAFVQTRPEVARRLPQYLIASCLGITPEALSRIRGRLARRPPT